MERKLCDNLGDDEKEQVRKDDKKRKMDKRSQTLEKRNSIFNNANYLTWMIHPYLQHQLSDYLKKISKEDFKSGPTYICDICWKFEFRRNVIELKERKYQTDIYNECTTVKSDWICKSSDNSSK